MTTTTCEFESLSLKGEGSHNHLSACTCGWAATVLFQTETEGRQFWHAQHA